MPTLGIAGSDGIPTGRDATLFRVLLTHLKQSLEGIDGVEEKDEDGNKAQNVWKLGW